MLLGDGFFNFVFSVLAGRIFDVHAKSTLAFKAPS